MYKCMLLFSTDIQQLLVVKEEVLSEQQVWISSLDQENPEPPNIKEEQEELWISQEGEQLQGLEEAGLKFSLTPVKSEAEEEAQSSQLQRRTEKMEIEADGDDCGGPEPASYADPDRPPDPDEKTGDSSEADTDDSVDWKKTRELPSGLNSLNNDEVSVRDSKCSSSQKPLSCSKCGKRFHLKRDFKKHMSTHTGEKPFSCSLCKTSFALRGNLKSHMITHTGEKPFSCSLCKTSFAQRGTLKNHMLTHTGEKPFSCSLCKTSFARSGDLKKHVNSHRRETFQLLSL
ncbi:Gastrula zinc finger protein XlCGF57.1 [Liparis tanakae]|uniref:Gastrula zinc finger protein XlCGF57.1 n=1 Tax=Liparis tanakae TaxID=230148 RepID=A0A4Z2ETY5_9TELE|nr:Gastrula zinc finger protein XlCGF57.1 [Liparis tanakae]